MNECRSLGIAALVAASLYAGSAQAGMQRTFVASTGLDTNPCTVTSPCRSFAFAITQTSPGGEIYVLDSAGYGAVTITQSISIVNQTSTAGVTASGSGSGVTINAAATDRIVLRGLTIVGGGSTGSGVIFNTGGSLAVEDCSISEFAGGGIIFAPNAGSRLYVSNTRISNMGFIGIYINPLIPSGTATVQATLERVEATDDTQAGVFVDGRQSGTAAKLFTTVADSVAAFNSSQGIVAVSSSGHAPVTVMVRNTTVSNNALGIFASAATLYLAHSTVNGNTTAFSGTVTSYGDNNVDGNGSLGTPPGSVLFH